MRSLTCLACLGVFLAAACSDPAETDKDKDPDEVCASSDDCASTPDTPFCDDVCSALPQGWQIGVGDGSVESVSLTLVLQPDVERKSTDLEFNPSVPNQLWVVNSQDDSVYIVDKTGEEGATWERKRDPAASHFMDKPPAIAFGDVVEPWGQTFGVCGDSDNGGNKFMGPALFSADPEIFTIETGTGLGSHLDMLHSTSFCRGIAHVEKNVYFAFNSDKGSLDKYDFVLDHGPGNDDHSDGQIFRYADGEVAGVDGIVSHLSYDAESKLLYAADTGNKRVVVLDTTKGERGASFSGDEPVDRSKMISYELTELIPPGTLEAPSGIEIHEGVLFVTDNATSKIYAFQKDGTLIRSLDTGLSAGSLAGITFNPTDNKLYFVDYKTSRAYRVDPKL